MNSWGEETEYDRARVKSQRRTERMAKYRGLKNGDSKNESTVKEGTGGGVSGIQNELPQNGIRNDD